VSDRRAEATAALRAHGVDANDVANIDPTVVRAGLAATDGATFVAALAEFGDAHVAAVLRELDSPETDRARRKMIRRALHRLRERGVVVPPPSPAATGPVLARPEPEREAWLSATDGAGTRLVWVAGAESSGQWLLIAAELNEPGGLVELRVSEVPRKRLRAARQHLRERGIALASVPFAVADALLLEGQQRRGEVARALDYVRLRPRLTTAPPERAAEPRSSHVVAPAGDEIEPLVAASARLLTEPELARWWPRPDDAAPFLEEIAVLEESPIVLSPAQQEARLATVLARAATALYPRSIVARRLRATAYVFAETARPDAARTALAVADALERDPNGTRDVPLLAALVHQGVGRLAAARSAERRKARQGSLVVTPGEALTDRSAARPPRTRS